MAAQHGHMEGLPTDALPAYPGTEASTADVMADLGFSSVASPEPLPRSGDDTISPPGAIHVDANDPLSFLPEMHSDGIATAFAQEVTQIPKRQCDPPLSKKQRLAVAAQQIALIEKLEKFVAPRVFKGQENRGTKEPHKQFPLYIRLFDQLRTDLREFKLDEFRKDYGEEEAKTMATSFCDTALPANTFKCDTLDGSPHKTLKNGEKEYNCMGCANRDALGSRRQQTDKSNLQQICDA